jgi:hypothetical protein
MYYGGNTEEQYCNAVRELISEIPLPKLGGICRIIDNTRVYPKLSGLASWSENCI